MKFLWFCVQLIICVLAQEYYDHRYDYFDIDTLVQNPRLLKKYMDCFLNRGRCPPIGRFFKARLPEVIISGCRKCSPRQRGFAKKAFDAFKRHLPESHEELKRRIDPKNIYYPAFERAIAN